jgi:hypothetical protein
MPRPLPRRKRPVFQRLRELWLGIKEAGSLSWQDGKAIQGPFKFRNLWEEIKTAWDYSKSGQFGALEMSSEEWEKYNQHLRNKSKEESSHDPPAKN